MPTELGTMIMEGEIDDRTIIHIMDRFGRHVTTGYWFNDRILALSEKLGEAYKSQTNNSVIFWMV